MLNFILLRMFKNMHMRLLNILTKKPKIPLTYKVIF